MRSLMVLPFCLALTATPAVSQMAVEQLLGPDAPCFSRTYDAAHLANHPDQQVTLMVVYLDVGDMAHDTGADLLLVIEVMVRDGAAPYSGIAYCDLVGDGLECGMEGDAGSFALTDDGGRLALAVGADGLSFEADDVLTLSGDTGDDRLFLLDAGVCG